MRQARKEKLALDKKRKENLLKYQKAKQRHKDKELSLLERSALKRLIAKPAALKQVPYLRVGLEGLLEKKIIKQEAGRYQLI